MNLIKLQRKRFLPLFMRQEAISLWAGEQYEDALNRLFEALMIDPLWPLYDIQELTIFYNNRRAWELSDYPNLEYLKRIPIYKERGLVGLPPNFQLFLDYLQMIPANINDFATKIDQWFSRLAKEFSNNPFIYLFWSDALKIPFQRQNRNEIDERIKKGQLYILPINILDMAIGKLEKAFEISPQIHIISLRLSTLLMQKMSYYEYGTSEFHDISTKVGHYLKKGKLYLLEYIPEGVRDK